MAIELEGLCYFIKFDPASTPQQNFDTFVDFCVNGVPDGMGGYEVDEEGREKTGVLNWLLHIPITEANFFATPPVLDGVLLGVSLLKTGIPWIDIPGFMDFVRAGQPPDLADADGQIKLASVLVVDDELRRRSEVLKLVPPDKLDPFKKALRGIKAPALGAIVDELDGALQTRIRDLLFHKA